jgi:hypothetical protein
MSRPQFATPQVSTIPGHIVNGGLIDFQDNFHRGMAEYMQYPSVPSMAGPAFASNGMSFMGSPAMGYPQGTNFPGSGQLPCISGPPSFIHVNGITYKPVEDPNGKGRGGQVTESAPEPAPRVLTDEDIDRRVRDRVESWASSQRKPVASSTSRSSGGRGVSEEDRVAARVLSMNEGMRGRFRSPC